MNGILDLLNSSAGQTLINGASQKTGTSTSQTQRVLAQAMPLIMGAMQRNAQTPQGAASLSNALDDPRHRGGGMMDMIGSIFGDGAGSPSALENEGNGILNHVFGAKKPQVESALSQNNGMDMATVSKIISFAAPIVMGYLSKKKHDSNPQTNDVSGLLGSVLGGMGGASTSNSSFLTSILDGDGDGSALDDVAGMLLGGNQQKGGGSLGGLLGGILGK
ncbi:MAG: DUF937 domain-containing protein [Nonlabens sp.]